MDEFYWIKDKVWNLSAGKNHIVKAIFLVRGGGRKIEYLPEKKNYSGEASVYSHSSAAEGSKNPWS